MKLQKYTLKDHLSWLYFKTKKKKKAKIPTVVLLEYINANTEPVSEITSVLLNSSNKAILAFQGVIFLLNLKQIFAKSLDIVPSAFQNALVNRFIINTVPHKHSIKPNLPAKFIHLFFLSGPKSWKYISSVITAQDDKENGIKRK